MKLDSLAGSSSRSTNGFAILTASSGKRVEPLERRAAGAEVVENEPDAETAQLVHALMRDVEVAHHVALGDLEHQASRREPSLEERASDVVGERLVRRARSARD